MKEELYARKHIYMRSVCSMKKLLLDAESGVDNYEIYYFTHHYLFSQLMLPAKKCNGINSSPKQDIPPLDTHQTHHHSNAIHHCHTSASDDFPPPRASPTTPWTQA